MEKTITYFETFGLKNTEETLRAASKRYKELGLKKVIIASSVGVTAVKALQYFDPREIAVVTSMYGFLKPGEPRLSEENRKVLTEAGAKLVFNTHVFAGLDRSVNRTYGGITPVQLMGQCYKLFGEGFKVCLECAVMAADVGAASPLENAMCIAGTGRGADTAIVLRPAHSNGFFQMRIREIVCMSSERSDKISGV
jgi:hypothetical protein